MNQERLKQLLTYDPDTGLFRWRTPPRGRMFGAIAGSLSSEGYCRIWLDGREYGAHRLAWLYMTGSIPDQVDHENHQRADNRWINLRPAGYVENARNKSVQKNNRLGIKGVRRSLSKFRASIYLNGKTVNLGSFDTAEEAAKAYANAAAEHFGEFACSYR